LFFWRFLSGWCRPGWGALLQQSVFLVIVATYVACSHRVTLSSHACPAPATHPHSISQPLIHHYCTRTLATTQPYTTSYKNNNKSGMCRHACSWTNLDYFCPCLCLSSGWVVWCGCFRQCHYCSVALCNLCALLTGLACCYLGRLLSLSAFLFVAQRCCAATTFLLIHSSACFSMHSFLFHTDRVDCRVLGQPV